MTIVDHNKNKLKELIELINSITDKIYTLPKEVLSGATVGQHLRHIIEFYSCLIHGEEKGLICYDERKRNLNIEISRDYALTYVGDMIEKLEAFNEDHAMILKACYNHYQDDNLIMRTSLSRELAYALDHTVHHLAIIKIALEEHKDEVVLSEDFGVAPSTIRYKKVHAGS